MVNSLGKCKTVTRAQCFSILAIKTIGYAGLFGGVVAAFGGIMYTLYSELKGTSGTYPMVQRAVSFIESDPKVRISSLNSFFISFFS